MRYGLATVGKEGTFVAGVLWSGEHGLLFTHLGWVIIIINCFRMRFLGLDLMGWVGEVWGSG